MGSLVIERVTDLPRDAIAELVQESTANGIEFLRRLESEWLSGANRFDRPGESLFVALREKHVVGVCGLNIDPYSESPSTGRLRHLYVAARCRREGIGRALVSKIVVEAAKSFAILTLRTGTAEADDFYAALGFKHTSLLQSSTHYLDLHGPAALALR
jgi:N-acetylglutamate synthase-like GNAT family acetyltransferase